MNYSDILKTKIVNRSGLTPIFLLLFVSMSLLPAINNTHARCESPNIADCFNHEDYYVPQIKPTPTNVADFCKQWISPVHSCGCNFTMAVYAPVGNCPIEIVITPPPGCTIKSVSVWTDSGSKTC